MFEVRFIAHNMPIRGERARLVSRHNTEADAKEAAVNYGQGAAAAARAEGRDAISSYAAGGSGVVVYVDGFTLWSEFYVDEVSA